MILPQQLDTPGVEVDLFDLLGGIPDVLDTLGKDLDELDRYDVIRYAMPEVPKLLVDHFPDVFTLDEKAIHPVVMKDLRVEDPQDPKAIMDFKIDGLELVQLIVKHKSYATQTTIIPKFRELAILGLMMSQYGAMSDLLEAVEALIIREIEAL